MTFPEVPLKAKAGAVVAACAISFVIGHGTRKTIEVEKIHEVQVQAEQKVEAARAEVVKAKAAASRQHQDVKERIIYLPSGEVQVDKEVVHDTARVSTEQAVRVVTKVVVETKTVYVDRVHEKLVAPVLPRWSVAARAGLNLDGRLQYGGEIGRRLGAGLWFTAGADIPNRAALVGLRLEF